MDFNKELLWNNLFGKLNYYDLKINLFSVGDITFYPYLEELIGKLKEYGLPIILNYTSGKGIKNFKMIENILNLGVDEMNVSIFSSNPELRRKWMGDKSPEMSLKAFEIFSQNIDVNASSVVIPGVTDLEDLYNTGNTLEEWGVKTFHLLRFGNFQNQGNIFNNRPVIDDIIPHSFEEFQEIVQALHKEFNFTVIGIPTFYPENDIPYILSNSNYSSYLKFLPEITSKATIITSKLSKKYLQKIFSNIDKNGLVNIISVDKELGDLIRPEDFSTVNLDDLKNKIIIPGNALMRDDEAGKLLSKDGRLKRIIRGPNALTPINEENTIIKERAVDFELNAFTNLINLINS
ncbi:radical SAM protein [Methanobacterium sp. SMA-27]|uniref:radical SAM protein n=1 Tax=Methanobacterium sp. SMA-27 TaxID=1495336 RepID=UPI0009DF84A2|nr:radical SAM protein [Methanobacterium sp. SMA-27]